MTRPRSEITMKPSAWLRAALASLTLAAFAVALPIRAHAIPHGGAATSGAAVDPSATSAGGGNQTDSPFGVAAAAACGAMIWLTGATGGAVPATWVGATAACLFVIFDAFFID